MANCLFWICLDIVHSLFKFGLWIKIFGSVAEYCLKIRRGTWHKIIIENCLQSGEDCKIILFKVIKGTANFCGDRSAAGGHGIVVTFPFYKLFILYAIEYEN